MIYDCFTFFNELDILEIRLNILNEIVDKFVIVEATKTHSNKEKLLYYEINKDRFKKFQDKIIYIIIDEYPEFKTAWDFENHQRNSILRGLIECKSTDIIIISDVDEIPNPDVIRNIQNIDGIITLEMSMYYYYLNCTDCKIQKWAKAKICNYGFIVNGKIDGKHIIYGVGLKKNSNIGNTPNKIRMYRKNKLIKNGGWHFSYLGGTEAIKEKIKAYSHQENNTRENENITIEEIISTGRSITPNYNTRYFSREIDESYPKYIRDNVEKYDYLILNSEMGKKIDLIFWAIVMTPKKFILNNAYKIYRFINLLKK